MSVDYESCKCCLEARYEEAVACCNGCCEYVCQDCVEENKNPEYFFEDRLIDDDGYLKKEYCPICKKKEEKRVENKKKKELSLKIPVNVGDSFTISRYGRKVEVEIKRII